MTNIEKRAILEQLARGDLATGEADRRLAELEEREADQPQADHPQSDHLQTGQPQADNATPNGHMADTTPDRTDASVVRATLSGAGLIEVRGDDTDEPYLDGPHSARIQRSGGTFDITGNVGPDAVLRIPRAADLTLEANSSSARVTGLSGTLHARFNVGQARVEGVFTQGSSTIVANVGELDIHLQQGSNVHATVNCAARIESDGNLRAAGRGQWTVGNGAAQLDISGTPGTIYLHG